VELAAATLQEFYSRMALGAGPADGAQSLNVPRRPGAVLSYQDRQRVLSIADAEAKRAFDELFGKREVCTTCHVVQRVAKEPGWAVAPVRFTQVWMPRAEFAHAAHASTKCIGCHAAAESQKAEDIAMPGIADCRECHVGSRPVLGKVTSDCATCHKFHGGGDLWQAPAQVQAASPATQ
jgi:predicted CXXCH cytochrome family protein